jgi:hypothetical protein
MRSDRSMWIILDYPVSLVDKFLCRVHDVPDRPGPMTGSHHMAGVFKAFIRAYFSLQYPASGRTAGGFFASPTTARHT